MILLYGMVLVSQFGLADLKQVMLGIAGRAVSETAFRLMDLYRIARRYRARAAILLTELL